MSGVCKVAGRTAVDVIAFLILVHSDGNEWTTVGIAAANCRWCPEKRRELWNNRADIANTREQVSKQWYWNRRIGIVCRKVH